MKRLSQYVVLLTIVAVCIGCAAKETNTKEDLGFDKATTIEVTNANNPDDVEEVMDNQEKIDAFTDSLEVNKWELSDIPDTAKADKMYKIMQLGTKTLKNSEESNDTLREIAAIVTYKDVPYVRFQTDKTIFHFKIPKEVAQDLSDR